MGTLLAVCRPRKRIAPAPSTADLPCPQQEATPSRAVRSCHTAGLSSAAGAAQMSPNTGGSDASARRRRLLGSPVEPHSFYKSLRQEEAALDLDRLHVLKIRNREAEGGAMTKDKFSKYSPLPDISRPQGRPLLRQKTYDVLEPVYVKGPSSPRHAAKDKPPPRAAERGKTAVVASRAVTRDGIPSVRDNTNPASNRRSTKLPHLAGPAHHVAAPAPHVAAPAPHVAAHAPAAAAPVKRPPLRKTTHFRPQELSKDILPQSPTAFWFPI